MKVRLNIQPDLVSRTLLVHVEVHDDNVSESDSDYLAVIAARLFHRTNDELDAGLKSRNMSSRDIAREPA